MKNLRNTHLLEAARKLAASGTTRQMECIARMVVSKPAPGYYVNYDRAVRYLHLYQRNMLPVNLSGNKRDMWTEIFNRMEATMQRHPGLSPTMALQHVLCQGQASSFFLNHRTAARILRRAQALSNNNKTNIAV